MKNVNALCLVLATCALSLSALNAHGFGSVPADTDDPLCGERMSAYKFMHEEIIVKENVRWGDVLPNSNQRSEKACSQPQATIERLYANAKAAIVDKYREAYARNHRTSVNDVSCELLSADKFFYSESYRGSCREGAARYNAYTFFFADDSRINYSIRCGRATPKTVGELRNERCHLLERCQLISVNPLQLENIRREKELYCQSAHLGPQTDPSEAAILHSITSVKKEQSSASNGNEDSDANTAR